jgi:hypothetical protein
VRKSPSLAELRKSAKAVAEPVAVAGAPVAKPAAAKPVSKPVVQPVSKPAATPGYNAKAAWAARLAEQAGNRLPRGVQAKQRQA